MYIFITGLEIIHYKTDTSVFFLDQIWKEIQIPSSAETRHSVAYANCSFCVALKAKVSLMKHALVLWS